MRTRRTSARAAAGPLIGRARELAQLRDLVNAAHEGRSGVLVVRGPAGIGKTALLGNALDDVGDATVVRTAGVESEATVSMAGVFDLTRPVLGALDGVAPMFARTLRGALGVGEDRRPPVDRFALGMAVLTLFAQAADERPVVVAVDDVHWLDSASRDALLFAARRLEAERIAMLFTVREEFEGQETESLPHLTLTPLAEDDAFLLLQRSAAGRLALPVAERLLAIAQGNPLALVELPKALTRPQRSGTAVLPDPMPVTARIESAFTQQVTALPESVRAALLVAAASFDRDVTVVMRALDALDLPRDCLEVAEQEDLVRLQGGRLRFRHPLVRSAVYALSGPVERRRAHSALAAAHSADADIEQRARHLAAAATDRDDAVADLLQQAGEEAQARGALAAASVDFESAADLSTVPDVRARRRLRAAEAAVPAGDGARASALLETALDEAQDLIAKAEVHHLRARLWIVGGSRVPDSEAFLAANAAAIAERDRRLGVAARIDAVILAVYGSDRDAAVRAGEAAVAMAAGGDDEMRMWAAIALAIALGCNGELAAARSLVTVADRLTHEQGPPVEALQLFGHVGLARGFAEDPQGARAALEPLIRRARADGAIGSLPFPLFITANAAFLMGDWAAAEPTADEAADLAEITGQLPMMAMAAMCQTLVSGGRGREEEAREHAATALALMDAVGYEAGKSTVHWALGLLELAHARYDSAVAAFRESGRLTQAGNAAPPGVVRWRAELVEALVAAGQEQEARDELTALEAVAAETGSDYARAAAQRCRGLLVGPEQVDATFTRALELFAAAPNPFEHGRTYLCWARRLIAAGRTADARKALGAAMAAFQSLEAVAWVDRTRELLEATGEQPAPRQTAISELLSGRELRIAVAAAQGTSEPDLASQLFMTPTAVRRTLAQAKAQLGVDSTEQLRRRLDAAGLLHSVDVAQDRTVVVSVLGGFDVRVGPDQVSGLGGAPAHALQIVAAHGGRIAADELAELLWPQEPRGRTRLRTVLWRLAETAGPLLVRDTTGEIRVADDVEVDVVMFEQEAEEATRAAASDVQAAVGPATRAVSRYVGDLLAGQRTETWVIGLRERFRRRHLAMLDLLVKAAAERGDRGAALSLLERAIDAEPYDDDRYLTAARLLIEDGRPAAARSFLQRGMTVAAELGVAVSSGFQALDEELRRRST